MEQKVSIIIPTFNESENIRDFISELIKSIGRPLHEIIVVDDNSPDGTWKVVERLGKRNRKIMLVRRINERGLPSAIATGIRKATGGIIVWLDSDFSHPPGLIPKMLKYFPAYDVVSASRYVKGGEDRRDLTRIMTSKMLNILGNFVLRIHVKDITSGFYAAKKKVFDKVKLKEDGYAEYCIKFSFDALKSGFKWKEIPYKFRDRAKGTSKSVGSVTNFLNNGYLCVKEIILLRIGRH